MAIDSQVDGVNGSEGCDFSPLDELALTCSSCGQRLTLRVPRFDSWNSAVDDEGPWIRRYARLLPVFPKSATQRGERRLRADRRSGSSRQARRGESRSPAADAKLDRNFQRTWKLRQLLPRRRSGVSHASVCTALATRRGATAITSRARVSRWQRSHRCRARQKMSGLRGTEDAPLYAIDAPFPEISAIAKRGR